MKNAEIKRRILEGLTNNEYAGFKYGKVKKVIIQNDGDTGFVGIFYKSCQVFETYKGRDTRPVEIFSYSIDIEEDEDDNGDIIETVHFYYDLHMDADSKDGEWKEKKDDKMTDREFFDYWV